MCVAEALLVQMCLCVCVLTYISVFVEQNDWQRCLEAITGG